MHYHNYKYLNYSKLNNIKLFFNTAQTSPIYILYQEEIGKWGHSSYPRVKKNSCNCEPYCVVFLTRRFRLYHGMYYELVTFTINLTFIQLQIQFHLKSNMIFLGGRSKFFLTWKLTHVERWTAWCLSSWKLLSNTK